EPTSMAWVLGQRAKDRSGQTWARALQAWPDVEDVAADGGAGLERGLELAAAQRQQAALASAADQPAKPLRAQLESFPIRRDGAGALRQQWAGAEAAWDEAVKIERAKERFDRGGTDKRKFNQKKVAKAWARAVALFEQVCRQEQAWERVVAAL